MHSTFWRLSGDADSNLTCSFATLNPIISVPGGPVTPKLTIEGELAEYESSPPQFHC